MELSDRQRKMLDFIRDYIQKNNLPPTIREIGQAVKISSTSVVNYNLNKLVEAGLIERDGKISRGIRLTTLGWRRGVPLLGEIPAGEPVPMFPESPESAEVLDLAADIIGKAERVYALRVQGDSMIEDLINDGDLVLLNHQSWANNGDIVAVWLEDEEQTTLKRFYHEGDKVRLQPANKDYPPIIVPADKVRIQGKLLAVIRRVEDGSSH